MSLSWTHPKDLAKFLSKTIVEQIIDLVLRRKKYHIVYREKKSLGNSGEWKWFSLHHLKYPFIDTPERLHDWHLSGRWLHLP